MTDYKDQVIYIGVDSSKNVSEIANRVKAIEEGCHIFDRFCILHGDTLVPQRLNRIFQEHFQPDIAVLCFSYALAKDTFEGERQAAEALTTKWRETLQQSGGCRETRIVYMNPDFGPAHYNWEFMVKKWMNCSSGDWRYNKTEQKSVPVKGLPRDVITQMIIGKKRV